MSLPLLPFLALVTIFLIVPTVTVIVSALFADGVFSLDRIAALFSETALSALWKSVLLSASTAIIGAVLGAVLAWLIVSSPPTSVVRRAVISLCSVLAQFGGVALAFAFLATIGLNGVLTVWVQQHFGWNLAGSGLAVQPDRADPRVHLLPDPADGDRVRARAGGAARAVARGGGEPRRIDVGSTGARWRCRC